MSVKTKVFSPIWNNRLMIFILIFGVVYAPPNLIAQTSIQTPSQADSLRRALEVAQHDTIRVNAMNALGEYFLRKKFRDSAIQYIHSAKRIAEGLNYQHGIASALFNNGIDLFHTRKYQKSLQSFQNALEIYKKQGNQNGIRRASFFIGVDYRNIGMYDKALENLFYSLQATEKYAVSAKKDISDTKKSISLTYKDLTRYDDALTWQFKALRDYEEFGNEADIISALGNIGEIYESMTNYDKAIEYHLKAFNKSRRLGRTDYLIFCMLNLGINYNKSANYFQAQSYLFQALKLQKQGKDEYITNIPKILNNIGISYRGRQKFDSAFTFSIQALIVADSLHFPFLVCSALEELSIISDSLGRHKDALIYYKRYVAVNDSLINLSNFNKAAELKEAYEAEKREQQITLLNKEKALQESEIARRNTIQWSLAGILLAVVAGAVWLGTLYRQKNAANKAILQQQALLEDQAQEIQQANAELHQQNEELTALNAEKNEIMGIVAHDLKNPIGVVRGFSQLIEQGFVEGNEVIKTAAHIQETSERMLALVTNLLDTNRLEQGGIQFQPVHFDLRFAVESKIEQYHASAKAKNITFHFHAEQQGYQVFADEQATAQVLDNLISNAVKYSPYGKSIHVRLCSSDDALRVEVEDEGEGISPDDMTKLFGKFARLSAQPTGGEHSTGLGLSIVKKMVQAMGGKVWCESELGKGATFIVELPIAKS